MDGSSKKVKNSKGVTACGSEPKSFFLLPTEEQFQVITGCHGDKKLEIRELNLQLNGLETILIS